MNQEVHSFDKNYILKAEDTALVDYLFLKYRIDPPVIQSDKVYTEEPGDTVIDVSGRSDYWIRSGDSARVGGTRIVIVIPFSGDSEFLYWSPARHDFNPPRADVRGQEIRLVYDTLPQDAPRIGNAYKQVLSGVERYTLAVQAEIAMFNDGLRQQALANIKNRKEKLLKDISIINSLGIPVRRSSQDALLFHPPEIRRAPVFHPPTVMPGAYSPDPAFPQEEYEHILKIIGDLSVAIERSPHAFAKMEEEHLRDHILIQLNGHYQGGATGETFSAKGKTDIFVRVSEKHVFLAECKFWKGPAAYEKTINQLFGYACWSDTKCAVIIFNRNKNHTTVLDAIAEHTPKHPRFKKQLPNKSVTQFRYLFKHPADDARDLYLAVSAIDLPTA